MKRRLRLRTCMTASAPGRRARRSPPCASIRCSRCQSLPERRRTRPAFASPRASIPSTSPAQFLAPRRWKRTAALILPSRLSANYSFRRSTKTAWRSHPCVPPRSFNRANTSPARAVMNPGRKRRARRPPHRWPCAARPPVCNPMRTAPTRSAIPDWSNPCSRPAAFPAMPNPRIRHPDWMPRPSARATPLSSPPM